MMINKKVSFIIFLLLGLQLPDVFSQQSTNRTQKGKLVYRTQGTGEARYLLKGDTLEFDNGICGYFGRLFKPLIRSNDGMLMLDSGFFIQQCLFRQSAKTVSNTLQECNTLKLRVGQKRYQQSGTSIKTKGVINRHGDPELRSLLYIASWSAIRFNASCKDLYERLKSKGKASKVALMAVINKLLRQAFAIVRSNTDYFDNHMPLVNKLNQKTFVI